MANQITVFLDSTKLPNQSMDQPTFDAAVAYLISNFPTFGQQFNAAIANLNASLNGVGNGIPYTIDLSSTADGDPGNGNLRFGSATQNASTVLRLDLLSSNAGDYTAVLDTFDASTSAVKGRIALVKQGDAKTFLIFDVTARAAPSGYRNITVTPVASSSANPFANGDAVLLYFQRTGDMGSAGASSLVLLSQATVSTAVANIDFLNVFTSAYDKYVIEFENIRVTAPDIPIIQLAVAGAVVNTNYTAVLASGSTISAASQGAVTLRNSSSSSTISNPSNNAGYTIEVRNANSATAYKGIGVCGMFYNGISFEAVAGEAAFNTTSPCTGFRLANSSGSTFQAATVRVYGIKNT